MKFTEKDLGKKFRDRITGFEGVAVARTVWLNGCVRYELQSTTLDKEGTVKDVQGFDEPHLELVIEKPIVEHPKESPGGPKPTASRNPSPRR